MFTSSSALNIKKIYGLKYSEYTTYKHYPHKQSGNMLLNETSILCGMWMMDCTISSIYVGVISKQLDNYTPL